MLREPVNKIGRMGPVIRNERGFVLVVGLLILIILTGIGVASLRTISFETRIAGHERTARGSLFAADGGIEQAIGVVWNESGFYNAANVDFTGMDTYFGYPSSPPTQASPQDIFSGPLGGGLYYDSKAVNYEADATKRVATFQSVGWYDLNGNAALDTGEPSKTVEAEVIFQYQTMNFPFGLMSTNLECLLCHAKITGDVVSLNQITIRKESEAYSIIDGAIKTLGTTNLDTNQQDANGINKDGFYTKVVKDYQDGDGDWNTVEGLNEEPLDITTGASDPRFPVDENGNPKWPELNNLDYYKGLATQYNEGAGSTVSGGAMTGVPFGSSYPAGSVNIAQLDQTYAGNLILDGTSSCVIIDGPIVVDGDIIIKGCVQGEGSLYAGGNVYVAGSLTYSDPSTDKLGMAAGGNVVMGDYRDKNDYPDGGGKFIEKQIEEFNDIMSKSGLPESEQRYYVAADGTVPGTSIDPSTTSADLVRYIMEDVLDPANTWMTTAQYTTVFLDTANGITQIDGLIYTPNAIFGINKVGMKKTTINGILSSADIGLIIPGPDGHSKNFNPANIGLTLNYDSRLSNFIEIARDPSKKIVSWKELGTGE